jgi:RND superfamily putative drug exporter
LNRVTARFHQLGLFLYRHRWAVIATWVALLGLGLWGAGQAADVMKGGAAGIPNSGSARAEALLSSQFQNPYQRSFIVTVTSDRFSLEDETLPQAVQELEDAVTGMPNVLKTMSYNDRPEPIFRSEDGHRTFIMVGLKAENHLDAEQNVVPMRERLAPIIAKWQQQDPNFRAYVTGEIPIGFDGARVLAEDTTTAEHRIFPLAVVFLLVVFGAVAAAGIPVLVGGAAAVLALGLLFVFGHVMSLSAMAQSIASMVALGIGIDYSLIIVSRFREELAKGREVREAVAETTAHACQAIVYSGLTVMIGFLALFIPNLIDTNSLALAGSLTVLVAVLLATTLLPAVLGVLGRWVDWPFQLSRAVGRFKTDHLWYNWAREVMKHRVRYLVLGTMVMLAFSIPAFTVVFGQFSSKFLPPGMESGYGLVELEKMGQAGRLYPISVVVTAKDDTKVFTPAALKAFAGVVTELRDAPVVEEVHSIVENASTLILMNNLFFNGDVKALRDRFPEAASLLISEDGRGTVIQLIVKNDAGYGDIKAFTRSLQQRDWSQLPGLANFTVEVGGYAATNNDFEHAVLSALPKVVATVFLVTFVLLAISFRSVVLPLKALVMNTLSVAASFGALVLVFQHGVGATWIGLPGGLGNMLVAVPIVIFCCIFGLSMDYEVFLLSRIQEEYEISGDNEQAVAAGLASTGALITNAAMIMLLVFGAFIAANVVLTKQLGFGLAVAVLLDALIIRMMLVPSFMAIVGDWNWWPNAKKKPAAATAVREEVGAPR